MTRSNSGKASLALISIIAVLVVGIVGAAIWWRFFRQTPAPVTPPPAPPHPAIIVISPNVENIHVKPLSITKSQIVFTGANQDLAPGKVLLSNVHGYGYSRKVTSVNIVNGKTICETTPASIKDVFKDLKYKTFTPGFNEQALGPVNKYSRNGISLNWANDLTTHQDPLQISFNGSSLNMGGPSNIPLSVTGSVVLTANPKITPDIDDNDTQEFEATYDCELKGSITIRATAVGNFNPPPSVLFDYPIGLPTVLIPGYLYAVPRLVITSNINGDILSEWQRTETFDAKAKEGLDFDSQTLSWKPDLETPTFSKPKDTGDNVAGSFQVDVMPIKVRLIYELYTSDPTYAYTHSDVDSYVGPYVDLQSDFYCFGYLSNVYDEDEFRIDGQIAAHIGIECGYADGFVSGISSVLGISQICQPVFIPIYHITVCDLYFPVSPSPGYRPYHRRWQHRARFNYAHLDHDINIEVIDGGEILKNRGWHDDLALIRNSQTNQVTINNAQPVIVTEGNNTISNGNQSIPGRLKAKSTHHLVNIYDAGDALLVVRNNLVHGELAHASIRKKLHIYRLVRSYTQQLRQSNGELVTIKRRISLTDEPPAAKSDQNMIPSQSSGTN